MPKDFKYWRKQHDNLEFGEFNIDRQGLLWLKVKSISRKTLIVDFLKEHDIEVKSTTVNGAFVEVFDILSKDVEMGHAMLDEYTRAKNIEIAGELDTKFLVNELYKVDSFKWGADNQNDLGKYLVKKYVKDNLSYDFLLEQMDTSVMRTVQDYLICTWYNHWSSILVEHIFKKHPIVLPTIGQIKSVDFFINDIPFDLKITYLPTNFIEDERKKAGLRPELTALKIAAREVGIEFGGDESNLYYLLTERLKDNGKDAALKCLQEIRDFRLSLIQGIKTNPLLLARNLYEKQSDFRFGAENRLFLILVDTESFENSWKLKRNIDLLQPSIFNYLDSFGTKDIESLKLKFHKEGNESKNPRVYEVITDVIVVEK